MRTGVARQSSLSLYGSLTLHGVDDRRTEPHCQGPVLPPPQKKKKYQKSQPIRRVLQDVMMRSLLIMWPYATFSMPNMTHGTDKCRIRLGKGQCRATKAESAISTLSRPRQCPTNDQKTRTCVRHDTVVGSGGGAKETAMTAWSGQGGSVYAYTTN
jgi:hypothetical protein